MDRCPELFELESFFEVAYTSGYRCDRDAWHYDLLKFERITGEEKIICEIKPAEEVLRFFWSVGGHVRLDLQLRFICSLEISSSAGTEHLIGHIKEGLIDQLFKLAIKPSVSFQLGTGLWW